MSRRSSLNSVRSDLNNSGATGFVLCVLGGAALSSIFLGAAPLLVTLAGFFAAFMFVAKFAEFFE